MAKIKQLSARNGGVSALIDVNGVIVRVTTDKPFKTHLQRNQEIIKKAKEQVNYEKGN